MMDAREVAKTPVLRKIDQFLHVEQNRYDVRQALKTGQYASLAEFMMSRQLLTPNEIAHVAKMWYDPRGGYWPNLPFATIKKEIVRQGFIKALDLSATAHLPIVTLWMCAGESFQAIVTKSAQQITLLLLTPGTPDLPPEKSLTEPEDIWLISGYPEMDELRRAAGYNPINPSQSWKTRYVDEKTGKTFELTHAPVTPEHLQDGVFTVQFHGEELNAYEQDVPDGVEVL